MPATKTQSNDRAQTPFREPVWPWNQPPLCGEPTRERCQSIVSHEESKAGVKLVAAYRVQESVVAVNDIDARAIAFEKPHAVRGVGAELLRREMPLVIMTPSWQHRPSSPSCAKRLSHW